MHGMENLWKIKRLCIWLRHPGAYNVFFGPTRGRQAVWEGCGVTMFRPRCSSGSSTQWRDRIADMVSQAVHPIQGERLDPIVLSNPHLGKDGDVPLLH
jgi:hypothetical protein